MARTTALANSNLFLHLTLSILWKLPLELLLDIVNVLGMNNFKITKGMSDNTLTKRQTQNYRTVCTWKTKNWRHVISNGCAQLNIWYIRLHNPYGLNMYHVGIFICNVEHRFINVTTCRYLRWRPVAKYRYIIFIDISWFESLNVVFLNM
jgi:hypothetical protein